MSDPHRAQRGNRRRAYAAADSDRMARIEENARRNWDRHPEIRSEHAGSFERYMRSIHHNITYG